MTKAKGKPRPLGRGAVSLDGWFRTGDVGYIAEDGGLVVLDRVKDVIKSGGKWIPSSILEAAISELPWVSLVAVIGVKNERWGERPIAVIKALEANIAPGGEAGGHRAPDGAGEAGEDKQVLGPR